MLRKILSLFHKRDPLEGLDLEIYEYAFYHSYEENPHPLGTREHVSWATGCKAHHEDAANAW